MQDKEHKLADLTDAIDPIVSAIYEQYEKRGESEQARTYLGASIIGKECKRALWYDFRWATREKFQGRMLRLFQTGHMAESRFVADLRSIGATVWDVDPSSGKQFGYQDFGGHMRGHCDGVAQNIPMGGAKPHLCEFKTHSAKSFADLKKNGLEKSKPQHYAQMQWYMGKMSLERGLYLACNKDNDELYSERIKFDPVRFEQIQAKGESVIFAGEPPPKLTDDPSFYLCKFCNHHGVCHGGQVPAVSCRTCVHSTPERQPSEEKPEGGRWSCAKHGPEIPVYAQRQGCNDHLPLPFLLTYAEAIDAGEGWIEFKRKDNGKEFVVLANGKSHPYPQFPIYTTHEIAAAKDHRAICDQGIEEIRQQFGGTLVG